MNIFSEVKEQLTTRQVAESYGLRIRKNGVACCPFHDDRHPSMREFADYRMLLYAIVLIIVMLATNNPTMKEFFHRISPAELLRRAKKKKAKSLQKEGA